MFSDRGYCKFTAALALLMGLAGCASFEPPKYTGEISKIERPIELKRVMGGKFAFTETSLTTISTVFRLGGTGMSMIGTGKVRYEASAHSSVSPAGKGYVMAVMFDSVSARPVGGKAGSESRPFKVEDLGYTGFLDGDGKIVAFDVDVMSEGWLSLDSEHKLSVRDTLGKWKKRRKRKPVLPDRIVLDDAIEIDVSDIYSEAGDKLSADFEGTGEASYRFAGTTTYRDRTHLVLILEGKIAGTSKKKNLKMTGELGGFTLIDIANGDPNHWELHVRVKATTPNATVTIEEETEGDMTRQ